MSERKFQLAGAIVKRRADCDETGWNRLASPIPAISECRTGFFIVWFGCVWTVTPDRLQQEKPHD